MVFLPILSPPALGASGQQRLAPVYYASLGPAPAAKPRLAAPRRLAGGWALPGGPASPPPGFDAPAGAAPGGQRPKAAPASPCAAEAAETGAGGPAQGPAVKLVFVYNADAGPLNGLKDLLHKTFAPNTYECALCANTYQLSGMRPEWKQAVAGLPLPTEFLHRDEFRQAYPALAGHPLPAAFSADAAGYLAPFISQQELDSLTLPALIALTQQRARALVATP